MVCLASTTCADCPESGQSNQITEEPIITFHAYVTSRKRGMGMAEPGYGSFLREKWLHHELKARSLGYLYLKEQLLRPVSSFVNGSDECCLDLQGMVLKRVSCYAILPIVFHSFLGTGRQLLLCRSQLCTSYESSFFH